jgi:hypothetical protein
MIITTIRTTQVDEVTLEERHTMVRVAIGTVGLGAAYRRPASVTHAGDRTALGDIDLTVRLMALALVVFAFAVRRFRS